MKIHHAQAHVKYQFMLVNNQYELWVHHVNGKGPILLWGKCPENIPMKNGCAQTRMHSNEFWLQIGPDMRLRALIIPLSNEPPPLLRFSLTGWILGTAEPRDVDPPAVNSGSGLTQQVGTRQSGVMSINDFMAQRQKSTHHGGHMPFSWIQMTAEDDCHQIFIANMGKELQLVYLKIEWETERHIIEEGEHVTLKDTGTNFDVFAASVPSGGAIRVVNIHADDRAFCCSISDVPPPSGGMSLQTEIPQHPTPSDNLGELTLTKVDASTASVADAEETEKKTVDVDEWESIFPPGN
eukprot:TRINITY_DN58206_c0_g1_i1.p1 TRINITY_DN58206_c0_g1~~TRINITY_DN58206_c0_g1_i1.p1  ORF type:complete len:342 (-),score=25.16 TRINITY_DN58206_c0_g1_i1:1226-2110(-)